MERKKLIRGAATAAVITAFMAVSLPKREEAPEVTPKFTPEVTSKFTPETIEINDIKSYYPELIGLPIKSEGVFTTLRGNGISWHNLTDAYFDEQKASTLFSFFESISENNLSGEVIVPGKIVPYTIHPLSERYGNALFIVPADAPRPSWGNEKSPGLTYRNFRPNVNVTAITLGAELINYPGLETPSEKASWAFTVEACQNSVVVSTDVSLQSSINGQESFCGSIGTAISLVQKGVPYEEYRALTVNHGVDLPTGPVPYTLFSKEQYVELQMQFKGFPLIIVDSRR